MKSSQQGEFLKNIKDESVDIQNSYALPYDIFTNSYIKKLYAYEVFGFPSLDTTPHRGPTAYKDIAQLQPVAIKVGKPSNKLEDNANYQTKVNEDKNIILDKEWWLVVQKNNGIGYNTICAFVVDYTPENMKNFHIYLENLRKKKAKNSNSEESSENQYTVSFTIKKLKNAGIKTTVVWPDPDRICNANNEIKFE